MKFGFIFPSAIAGLLTLTGRYRMYAVRDGREGSCIAAWTMSLGVLGLADVRRARKARVVKKVRCLPRFAGLTKRKIKGFLTGELKLTSPLKCYSSRAGYADIAEGHGAILINLGTFDHDALDILGKLWRVDDIWLLVQMQRKGVPIWSPKGFVTARGSDGGFQSALYPSAIEGLGCYDANGACAKYLQNTCGIWR